MQSHPYELPIDPEIVLRTSLETEEESAMAIAAYLERHGYLSRD
jgi:adenylylsulfate kinase-like enzyme